MSSDRHTITVYTTKQCVYCQAEKQYLDENNIVFKEIRVDDDAAEAEKMIQRSGQMGVPYTVITNQVTGNELEVVGFDRARLTNMIGAA